MTVVVHRASVLATAQLLPAVVDVTALSSTLLPLSVLFTVTENVIFSFSFTSIFLFHFIFYLSYFTYLSFFSSSLFYLSSSITSYIFSFKLSLFYFFFSFFFIFSF